MSLLLIVVSSHFIVNNILEVRYCSESVLWTKRADLASQGMIWFWVPASLVIMNDVAAYVCGTSLILAMEAPEQELINIVDFRRHGLWTPSAHQA